VSARRTGDSGCTSSVPTPNPPSGGPNAKRTATRTGGMDLDGVATLAHTGTPTAQDAKHGGLSPSEMQRDPNVLRNQVHLAAVTTPTATERSGKGERNTALTIEAQLSAVPSPCTPNGGRSISTDKMDATGRTTDGRKHTASLEHTVKFSELAHCPTPRANDAEKRGQVADDIRNGLVTTANLSSTRTPSASDAERGVNPTPDKKAGQHSLVTEASMATVATPTGCDWKGAPKDAWVRKDGKLRNDRLDFQAAMSEPTPARQAQLAASGPAATGGTAETANGGQLNPAYSRWLMGLPPVFCDCAVTAMQFVRKRRARL
jgi:hypothetical protein